MLIRVISHEFDYKFFREILTLLVIEGSEHGRAAMSGLSGSEVHDGSDWRFRHSQHFKANSGFDSSVLGPLGFPDFLFGNVFEFSSD